MWWGIFFLHSGIWEEKLGTKQGPSRFWKNYTQCRQQCLFFGFRVPIPLLSSGYMSVFTFSALSQKLIALCFSAGISAQPNGSKMLLPYARICRSWPQAGGGSRLLVRRAARSCTTARQAGAYYCVVQAEDTRKRINDTARECTEKDESRKYV
jgi:hypothetical protein